MVKRYQRQPLGPKWLRNNPVATILNPFDVCFSTYDGHDASKRNLKIMKDTYLKHFVEKLRNPKHDSLRPIRRVPHITMGGMWRDGDGYMGGRYCAEVGVTGVAE